MRAHELLLEYDRSREQQRIEAIPAYQDRIKQDRDFSLDQLEQADPTPAKSYVPRLATWWLQGTPLEDLTSRGADALEKYQTLKQRNQLNPDHRDIGRFKKFSDFETAMRGYQVAEPETKEDRGRYEEIYRDDELVVVKLLDETAAKFWGRNTQWCTAAQRGNMFRYYANQGPLFVITPRKPTLPGERYQYWFDQDYRDKMQFMNEHDEPVNPLSLRFYAKLQNIFSKITDHIAWKANPTEEEQIAAVQQTGANLKYIRNPSDEAQKTAIRRDLAVFKELINPSESVQEYAVSELGNYIKYIASPSERVQIAAVRCQGRSIRFISNPSERVQIEAVRSDGEALKFIPNPSETVQLAAVRSDGAALKLSLIHI